MPAARYFCDQEVQANAVRLKSGGFRFPPVPPLKRPLRGAITPAVGFGEALARGLGGIAMTFTEAIVARYTQLCEEKGITLKSCPAGQACR